MDPGQDDSTEAVVSSASEHTPIDEISSNNRLYGDVTWLGLAQGSLYVARPVAILAM